LRAELKEKMKAARQQRKGEANHDGPVFRLGLVELDQADKVNPVGEEEPIGCDTTESDNDDNEAKSDDNDISPILQRQELPSWITAPSTQISTSLQHKRGIRLVHQHNLLLACNNSAVDLVDVGQLLWSLWRSLFHGPYQVFLDLLHQSPWYDTNTQIQLWHDELSEIRDLVAQQWMRTNMSPDVLRTAVNKWSLAFMHLPLNVQKAMTSETHPDFVARVKAHVVLFYERMFLTVRTLENLMVLYHVRSRAEGSFPSIFSLLCMFQIF